MATKTQTSQLTAAGLHDLQFPDLPPFPAHIPTAPLYRLSLSSLRTSPNESYRLFSTSKELGFFYLDLRGDEGGEKLLALSTELFDLAPKLFGLGREELGKFDYKAKGSYVGYKGFGSAVVDEKGNLDKNEFYNIAKDDFLSISHPPFAHPHILHEHSTLIKEYIHRSHSLVLFILSELNAHLKLPPQTLSSLHRLTSPSGDQIRLIKSPPQPLASRGTSMGKHTDFGSLTLLFNRIGGLQILPPGTDPEWTYVKPLPGHCIVNLGDAMTKLTNGLLRSNIHRVVAPPGEQAEWTRYSVVYFARPEDDVVLRTLESEIIPKREEKSEEEMSAKEWILLQALRLRNVDSGMGEEERKRLWNESRRGV